ncbi:MULTISPECIES: peptidase M4 [unclassified Meiothermus]|uniref:peptidase M4 n=1 Tax=unclassified Meiothermus TaxID=370471 RepID=UPI000D7C0EB7|nr:MULTISPECIES: peptidase M4 [unclassified Meiothermus]PZA07615.1 peptidase M4 [Meiothermus sp. Pnk-1]RYM29405.1 peptidase M4 [Meiothermus sp. PNK-Is4]
MKRGLLWLGITGLAAVGIALTQGMWGNPGYGYGPGMMMGGGMGMGMMGIYPAQAQPIPPAEARARLEAFAKRFSPEARLKDFMSFSENYYAQVVDVRGNGLVEILADRYTGNIYLEPGPNMMWNTRLGMGYGMMGMMQSQPPTTAHYDKAAAQKLAEQFLKGYLPGAKVMEGQAFGGYYTFDFGRKEIEGMLSVNAYTGEVWIHAWHGIFLGE